MSIFFRAKFIIPLLAGAVSLLPFTEVVAGGKNFKPKPPPMPQYTAITAIDSGAHTVTCTQMYGRMIGSKTLKVDDRTEIVVNGLKGKFEDIQKGMQVLVTVGMDPEFAARLAVSPAPQAPTPYPTPIPPPKAPARPRK